jgi:hypothetical protein
METYLINAVFLLLAFGGVIYGAGSKLATKKELTEMEKRIDIRIVEHEKINREEMKEIRDMFQQIRNKIDMKLNQ